MFRRLLLATTVSTVGMLSIWMPLISAIAQEYPGCFRINSQTGRQESLNHLCRFPKPPASPKKPDPFKVQLVDGLELTDLRLSNEGSQRFLLGRLTNKQSKVAKIQSISVQFLDKRDGTVVQFLAVDLGGVLAPSQGYEFRKLLDNALELGARDSDELSIKFLDWE